MSDHPLPDPLARLVSDAVSDVEPHERLGEIRARTGAPGRRRGWYAAGGAVLAAAAVVVTVAVLGSSAGPTADPDPLGATPPTAATDEPTEKPTDEPTDEPTASGEVSTYTLYYVGETARGPRLFSEQRDLPGPRDLTTALRALEEAPADPDYRGLWPLGAFADAGFDGVGEDGLVVVTIADPALRERPAGMSEEEARLAVESVVWTMQAALSEGPTPVRAPVQLRLSTNPIDQVYGVPTSEPLAHGSSDDVLSQMSITAPAEGAVVAGSFVAEGRNNGFEATMTWQVTDASGAVVLDDFATAAGWGGGRLFPWSTGPIDVTGLAPGTYTFVAANDDPSGGEGFAPDTDTRTITVE